jgi:UDP-3-O-[3-hydroxymyristoyl] glucosamine N-acyltransferase LpxD
LNYNIKDLVSKMGVSYTSEGSSTNVDGAASITEASENEISFCYYERERAASLVSMSNAGVILCKTDLEGFVHPPPGKKQQLIFLDNPRLAFVHITNQIYNKKTMNGVSSHAVISENAKIGSNCYIGHYTTIGDNCTIGDNTVIYDKVTLVQNCSIGNGCIIQPGVTMGADGFAFERHPNGDLERFPHLKGVRIGNNVEVCANTNIARGSLSDTTIGDGTKVDALVQIAHNVKIGKNTEITTGTIIGGSTSIGNMTWTGLNSTLKDNIKVGNNVLIGAGAAVIKDVQDGDIVAGVPAKSIKDKVTTNLLYLMRGKN